MKTLITTIIMVGLLFAASADEIQTLTNDGTTYRATVRPDVVFYNIVGKTSPTRTNVNGWLNLKTNLLNQGFTYKSDRVLTNAVSPLIINGVDDLTARGLQARQGYNAQVAAAEARKRAAAEQAMKQRALNDPNLREAAIAAYNKRNEDEAVSQGLKAIKEGRNVRLP